MTERLTVTTVVPSGIVVTVAPLGTRCTQALGTSPPGGAPAELATVAPWVEVRAPVFPRHRMQSTPFQNVNVARCATALLLK
jgi:hypothetical protein